MICKRCALNAVKGVAESLSVYRVLAKARTEDRFEAAQALMGIDQRPLCRL